MNLLVFLVYIYFFLTDSAFNLDEGLRNQIFFKLVQVLESSVQKVPQVYVNSDLVLYPFSALAKGCKKFMSKNGMLCVS